MLIIISKIYLMTYLRFGSKIDVNIKIPRVYGKQDKIINVNVKNPITKYPFIYDKINGKTIDKLA
jgi:hypothetical protein